MRSDYSRVSNIGRWKMLVLVIATTFTVGLTINSKYNFDKTYSSIAIAVELVTGINVVLTLLYLFLDFYGNHIYSKAENNKILQFIDNSFDTNFASPASPNYFSQNSLAPGFYKCCVNCFENTFFTFNIAKDMQFFAYLKAGIVLALFILSATIGERSVARSLTEAILPTVLFMDAVKLSLFVSRLQELLNSFRGFFSSIKNKPFDNKEPEALKNVIEYETTIARASIPLDSKIYNKLNPQLSTEWDQMKSSYQI